MALPSSSLRVECLALGVEDSTLLEIFQDFGAIHAVVIKHKKTGTSQVIVAGLRAQDRTFSVPCRRWVESDSGVISACIDQLHYCPRRSQGFGFVSFPAVDDAMRALCKSPRDVGRTRVRN